MAYLKRQRTAARVLRLLAVAKVGPFVTRKATTTRLGSLVRAKGIALSRPTIRSVKTAFLSGRHG